MTFAWTDREGCHHSLDDPAPIVAEAEAIAREIDRLVPGIENADLKIRDTARRLIAPLIARLEARNADLDRWNAHADRQTIAAATELVEQIERLPAMIPAVTLVVALNDEHDQMLATTSGAPQTRASILVGRATATQRRAFMAIDIRSMPPETMTRAEAWTALGEEPRFARRRSDTNGWFAWTDRHAHAHRLVDPLPIERELVGLAGELAAMLPALRDHRAPDVLFATVQAAATRWQRLTIIQQDLGRFGREAEARDVEQCKQFAADWRSKRNK